MKKMKKNLFSCASGYSVTGQTGSPYLSGFINFVISVMILILGFTNQNHVFAQSSPCQFSFSVKNSFTGRGIPSQITFSNGIEIKSVQTNEFGKVVIQVTPGKYDFEISSPSFIEQNSNYSLELGKALNILVSLDAVTPPEIETVHAKAIISGYIMDDVGSQPIVGAEIKLNNVKNIAVTNSSGFFQIESDIYTPRNTDEINPKKCNLTVTKQGYGTFKYLDMPLYEDNLILKLSLSKGKKVQEVKYTHKLMDENKNYQDEDSKQKFDEFIQDKNSNDQQQSLLSCSPPSMIRVYHGANSGPCTSCSGCSVIEQMSLENYVKTGLDNEWIASWNDASLLAGAVAYRTYGAYYVYHPMNSASYDIVAYQCKQKWDGTNSYTATINAANSTTGQVLVTSSNSIAFSEYAAETNNWGCGNGWTGCTTCGSPVSQCIQDAVCSGYTPSGHWRGMCQWGSHRWAQQGQTYTWILDHYYVPNNIFRCSSTPTCSVPSGIYYSNVTSNSANVSCTPVNGATQYSIGVKPSYNSSYIYYTVSSLPIYLTNLLSGTTYNYKLAAYCSSYGWTSYSSVYSFTTSSSSTCTTPYSLFVSAISSTSVTINWTSPGAVSYNYYLKPASQSSYWSYPNYTYKPITFSGLTPSTTYNFRVSSNCSSSTSSQSSVLTFTTSAFRNGENQNPDDNISLSGEYFTVSPNPIKSGGSVKFESRIRPKEVSLNSIDGKILSRKSITENSFEIPSAISPGIYFLKAIFEDGNTSVVKVVIQ
jgi:stage II sporulation SpoD-like protein/fibronectin type III domain protein